MSSSYYVTYGTDRLTFGGSGSVAWEAKPKQVFIVKSDNPNVYFTGAAYNSAGQVMTSFTVHGGSASAEFPSGIVSARMTASAADYYATRFGVEGGENFSASWTRAGRYGSGTVTFTGDSLTLKSYDGNTNNFTASGVFSQDVTARYGWMVPAVVNYVKKDIGSYYKDVSASRNLNCLVWTAPYQPGSYPRTVNALSGTYSSMSAYVKMVGSSYRRNGNGSFSYPMYGAGPKSWSWNAGAGRVAAGGWSTTTRETAFTYSSWSPGTGVDGAGNSKTLWICDYYDNTAIYTVCTGSWIITGIAK